MHALLFRKVSACWVLAKITRSNIPVPPQVLEKVENSVSLTARQSHNKSNKNNYLVFYWIE